ncbi:hypothetical protein SAMN05443247_01887 [Bradyrhizobium erythrophlei]|nr:hypothetical protein SAMN05443247_01887 [Bradyrhizobium erythrophlei]
MISLSTVKYPCVPVVMAGLDPAIHAFVAAEKGNVRDVSLRRVGKATGSRQCAPDDRLRVPTVCHNDFVDRWWARREARLCPPYKWPTVYIGRTSTTSGTKCLSKFWMPCCSVAVDDGQPEHEPFMLR